MAVKPSYLTSVKLAGTSTTLTSEPCSSYSTAARTYRVTNAAKRLFDRTQAFTFKKGATTVVPTSIDYMFGVVQLSTANTATTGTLKATGKYIPLVDIAGANAYTLALGRTLLEDTTFASTGWKSRIPGLLDASGTISRFDNLDLTFINLINSNAQTVVEIQPGGAGGAVYRGWFILEKDDRSGDVSALEKGEVSMQIVTPDNGGAGQTFSVGTT